MGEGHLSNVSLSLLGGALTQRRQAEKLLACNEQTAPHGLTLTANQAEALTVTQEETLKVTGRVEFGCGVTERLIFAFCDSPYITQENYEATLHELIEMFYAFKNETADEVGDDALIDVMKEAFDGECCGSVELLSGTALPAFVKARKACGSPFENGEAFDDEP